STTIIITTRTTISTATSIAKVATGSIIRNTGEMRLMGTGKRRINSVVKVLAALAEPVVREALAELVELAGQVAQEALAGLAGPVGQEALGALAVAVAREAPVGLAVQVAREALVGLAVQVAREALVGLAVQVAREALVELVVQVVPVEPGTDLVVAEQALVPVAAELLPRTRLVTVARRLVLVAGGIAGGGMVVGAGNTRRRPAG